MPVSLSLALSVSSAKAFREPQLFWRPGVQCSVSVHVLESGPGKVIADSSLGNIARRRISICQNLNIWFTTLSVDRLDDATQTTRSSPHCSSEVTGFLFLIQPIKILTLIWWCNMAGELAIHVFRHAINYWLFVKCMQCYWLWITLESS